HLETPVISLLTIWGRSGADWKSVGHYERLKPFVNIDVPRRRAIAKPVVSAKNGMGGAPLNLEGNLAGSVYSATPRRTLRLGGVGFWKMLTPKTPSMQRKAQRTPPFLVAFSLRGTCVTDRMCRQMVVFRAEPQFVFRAQSGS